MPNNTNPRPERKPSIPHCKYKLSAAKRTRDAFAQLCAVLGREWSGICAMNLGVKSGTGVIDDVLISQLRQLASTVHMLAVTDAQASSVLVKAASRLSTQQFQNLQVLLDMLRQEELSDFLRLMCRSLWTHTCTPADQPDARPHTANSSSSAASASKQRPSSSSATATEERPASPGRLQALGKWHLAVASATGGGLKPAAAGASSKGPASSSTAASPTNHGLTSRQRRVRAAAGMFELSQAGFGGLPVDGFLGDEDDKEQQQQQQRAAGGDKSGAEAAPASSGLKFAQLLPPGHLLVKTAESLKQQQEFQAALACATPRQAKQRAAVPPLRLPQFGLLPAAGADSAGLLHLPGYSHAHPVDYMGVMQGGDAGPSTGGSCRSQGDQAAAGGPWRGSMLDSLPGLAMHQQHQQHQQQHYPAGAFFLSSCGGDGSLQARQQQFQHMSSTAAVLHAQQQQQPFRAPAVSLEKLWKAGRAATTAAVLEAAHLSVRQAAAGEATSLLLSVGMVVPTLSHWQQQLAARAQSASVDPCRRDSRASNNSRRPSSSSAAGGSWPCSARGKPSSVPMLALQKLGSGGVGERPGGSGSSGSRPGSAAARRR